MSQQGQGDVVGPRSFTAIVDDLQAVADQYRSGMQPFTAPTMAALFDRCVRELQPHLAEYDRLRTLLSSSRGEQAWIPIDHAPKSRPIIGKTAAGRIVKAKWVRLDDDTAGWGTPEEDDPRPNCWDDGFCWASNSDEMPSDPLVAYIEMPGSVPTSLAGQVPDAAKEEAAAAYFRSAVADGQAAILLADLATYDNVLRELGIQESHKHPVDEVRRVQRLAEAAQSQGVEAAAELIDRKVSDYTSEHGNLDPETGVMEFSRAGEEYVSTLEELAEEIRAINSAAPQPTAGGDAP